MVLPNRNVGSGAKYTSTSDGLSHQEKLIVDYIKKKGSITDEEIQYMPGVKQTRVYVIVRTLKAKGIIVTNGRGINKKHYLK